jgi:hypothetical protein
MHSTTGRDRDCQSLDSDVLTNKEDASAISVPQECWLIRTEFSVGRAGESVEVEEPVMK